MVKKCPINIEKQKLEKASDSVSSHKITKSLASAGCSTKANTNKKDLLLGLMPLVILNSMHLRVLTRQWCVKAWILQEQEKMNSRLDVVGQQVAGTSSKTSNNIRKKKLCIVFKYDKSDCKSNSKSSYVLFTDASSEDSDFPTLYDIKSSKAVQRKIDHSLANLYSSHVQQNTKESQKLKSKGGGGWKS